jgi:hypothetical protein
MEMIVREKGGEQRSETRGQREPSGGIFDGELISRSANTILVSAASAWEIASKEDG